MKLIKRELLLCLSLTAFVFVCALAWGSPFLAVGSSSSASHAEAQTAHALEFSGTIVRSGDQYLLRQASGQLFHLDGSQAVESFEGKAVTISGALEQGGITIRVERIELATI